MLESWTIISVLAGVTLTVSLTQTNPFPPGEYVLKYTIHDLPSGNSFDITKNIRIANG